MKKKWSAKEKSQIVLEGIKGRPVVDICAAYGVSQSLYYAWRDKFFASVSDVLIVQKNLVSPQIFFHSYSPNLSQNNWLI
jgi:transposase-like protein